MHGLRWVDASGCLNVDVLGYRPVEGGHEADGTSLYIVKASYEDAVYPGKASEKLDGLFTLLVRFPSLIERKGRLFHVTERRRR
jgi:hypothetical protein